MITLVTFFKEIPIFTFILRWLKTELKVKEDPHTFNKYVSSEIIMSVNIPGNLSEDLQNALQLLIKPLHASQFK